MICSLSVVCSAEENYVKTDQKIMYENKYININESIVNINGSIYVPVRTFCEQIGYTVNWTPEAITLIKNEKNKKCILTIKGLNYRIDEKRKVKESVRGFTPLKQHLPMWIESKYREIHEKEQ